MAKAGEGSYEDQLEQEIFELEAFLHSRGLSKQMEMWRKSADYETDLKDYERHIEEEAKKIDEENSGENEQDQ
ncbi:MAG TPA: hypothetical protein VJB12_03810 [Candidatus Nanoarchaeia archaeon]|nr:hypothetical protein [Candidatus Nanoarchaeia archaeon]